jgi:uncharacterized protein YbjT (DUF2867 family)
MSSHTARITVFGATGSVGRHVVEQALATGHSVTAFTRDASHVTARHDRLEVVVGDATVTEEVLPAVKGADAVIVVLGDGRGAGVREHGTRAVVEAMQAAGVRRLVCQSTLGAGDSRGNLNFVWKYVMFGMLLRAAYADHQRQEEVVRASDTDWTIVRPSAFTDGPRTGAYRHGFGPDEKGLDLKISRADVADFLLRQVSDDTAVGRAVAVSC